MIEPFYLTRTSMVQDWSLTSRFSFCVIQETRLMSFTPLQRCNGRILETKLTGLLCVFPWHFIHSWCKMHLLLPRCLSKYTVHLSFSSCIIASIFQTKQSRISYRRLSSVEWRILRKIKNNVLSKWYKYIEAEGKIKIVWIFSCLSFQSSKRAEKFHGKK